MGTPTSSIAIVITVPTLAALSAVPTKTFVSGTHALVAQTPALQGPQLFTLQSATGDTPNALNVVATEDDVSRQWVLAVLFSGSTLTFFTPETDLKAVQQVVAVPNVNKRMRLISGPAVLITQTAGASVSPTSSIGTNPSNYNNLVVSNALAGIATQAAGTSLNYTAAFPAVFLSLQAAPLIWNITGGASATTLKAILATTVALF